MPTYFPITHSCAHLEVCTGVLGWVTLPAPLERTASSAWGGSLRMMGAWVSTSLAEISLGEGSACEARACGALEVRGVWLIKVPNRPSAITPCTV